MTIQVLFLCDYSHCHARENVLAWQGAWPFPDDLELPEGWGLERDGMEWRLHCPEHRSA